MSVKQYETYMAETFIDWVGGTIEAGERYQFKSPDPENALKLWQAFASLAEGNQLEIAPGQKVYYLSCNGIQLIPVLHGDVAPAFTENYISHLRDEVSGLSGIFAQTALLIIHNSMLDTLINSTKDVAAPGAIWCPKTFSNQLGKLITAGSNRSELSRCLLDDQLATVLDEGATVFGFSSLYRLLDDGHLDFSELHLFRDDELLNYSQKQLRTRLNENRKLYRQIEDSVERYSGQLENVLTEFSTKFIQEHFVDKDDWRELEFSDYRKEKAQNSEQKLVLENISVENGEIWQRAKSASKAGKRDISLMVQVQPGQSTVEIEFSFLGNDLQDNQIKISHHRQLKNESFWRTSRAGGKTSRIMASVPFDGHPCFFSLELTNRNNSAEEYKFRLLLVEQGQYWLNDIKNCYRIEPGKEQITLQLEDNVLRIAESGSLTYVLDEESDRVDSQHYAQVNFETLANQSDLVQFTLVSGENSLLFNIEGPGAEEGLVLPLLFDQSRFNKLFKEEGNATWSRLKGRIILDNTEYKVVGVRQQLLMLEASLIDRLLLGMGSNESEFALNELLTSHPDLQNAYQQLFAYFQRHSTLPSLVSWSAEYRSLVSYVVNTFEQALLQISLSKALTAQEKRLLHLGIYRDDSHERLSPLHPLVLAYHLQLAESIVDEFEKHSSSSFATLPPITLDRLMMSGLMPFVYHNEHEYAQLQPVEENRFWIDVVPQRQVSHDYVKRLVKDKLNEFTDAYGRLFQNSGNNSLIVNAINQGNAKEIFLGIVEYFKQKKEHAISVHLNCYDERLLPNMFDHFAESGSYEQLKNDLDLNSGVWRAEADMLIDLLRSRLTFSKFVLPTESDKMAYAHLAFFTNTAPVDCRQICIEDASSGVLCHGLIAGEGAETQGDAYFTAFGLRNVNTEHYSALRLARLIGCLWQPARQSNSQYHGQGIGLAVSGDFKQLLNYSYNSALWTTIIDPKVTLDFFTNQKDVVLIHYSDQYTSCAGYDAVTVTKQVDLFLRLLQTGQHSVDSQHLLAEFNAFNGEWLLKMLRSNDRERKEKHGIIGAYKFVQSMLQQSDICWIPLSVAEMIRVSGNVGLKMKESDLSRNLQGYRKGAISDDVLFVGFKENRLYLLPLEVKTGARPDYSYAGQQARELKRYLQQDILEPQTLASQLYRALFIRQVLMQVEKLRLYGVLDSDKLAPLLVRREWWLTGDYQIGDLADYPNGFVVAHVDSGTCFDLSFRESAGNILQVEIPYTILPSLIAAKVDESPLAERYSVPEKYRLKPEFDATPRELENETGVITSTTPEKKSEAESLKAASVTALPLEKNNTPLQILFGHDATRQSPLLWEPTNTAKFMNTNTGIIGTMGTGKTQFTKSLVTQLMRNQSFNVDGKPIGLLIFDYKSDYVDDAFLNATNAKKYKLFKLPYNPLSLFGDTPMLPIHTAGGLSETMAKAYGLGHRQQLKLENLILECYEASGISAEDPSTWSRTAPTIEDVWQRFLNQEKVEEDSLYAALSKLARYKIFETIPEKMTSLYELVEGVTVIELAGYPPEIQNLVVALTLDLFYAQMQKRGKPVVKGDYRQITKMILVDEADNFMRQDFASLRKILKEGREYGVGAILSTQEITHFKTGENNYASYILTWVIHRVSEIKNGDIKAVFNVDEKNEQESLMGVIRQLDKHYSLYINGEKEINKMRDRAFWELNS